MSLIVSGMPAFSYSQSPKVVVVGGGIAGLTTAYRLKSAGMNVELYEARGRVGGRIFTAIVNGRTAELGGQNFSDGGAAVNLNSLIDEFGLKCCPSRVYLKHSYFDGINLIPIEEILKDRKIDPENLKNKLDRLASTHVNMKDILGEIFDPQDPLYKVLAVRLAAYEGGTIEKLSPLYTETLYHMILGGICAAHQANQEKDTHVDLVTLEGGNSLLPQKIGEALGSSLHLNKPLTQVSKTQEGVFQLTFQDGTESEADLLVLAIPCTVYDQITFEKGIIPDQKLDAIQSIRYGENAKIMVPFTTIPSTTSGVVSDNFSSFFDHTQQLLTIYYSGHTSLFSPQTITSTYIQTRPMIELGYDECPPYMPPVYAKDEANLSYDGPLGYSWPNDPYAKGTYSYISSGQESLLTETVEENGETFKSLFAPTDSNLYFAGEHASILFDVPGTMEAACESGERIARTIIQKNKTYENQK